MDWQSRALKDRGRATGTVDAGLPEEGLAAAGAEASRLGAGGAVGEIKGFTASEADEQLTGVGVFRADGNLDAIAPGADPAASDSASWYAGLEAKPLAGGAVEKAWTGPATQQDLLVLKKAGTPTTQYLLANADGAEVRLYDPRTRQTGPALTRAEGGWRITGPVPAEEALPIDAPADVRQAAGRARLRGQHDRRGNLAEGHAHGSAQPGHAAASGWMGWTCSSRSWKACAPR